MTLFVWNEEAEVRKARQDQVDPRLQELHELVVADRLAQVNLEKETEDMWHMSECEKYGYTYGCNLKCPVLLRGCCDIEGEVMRELGVETNT